MECLGGKTNNSEVTMILNNCHQKNGLTIKQKIEYKVYDISNLNQHCYISFLEIVTYYILFTKD